MEKRILVAAAYGDDFRHWCVENRISPYNPLLRRISKKEDLMGISGDAFIILVDGWYRNDSLHRGVLDWCMIRGKNLDDLFNNRLSTHYTSDEVLH